MSEIRNQLKSQSIDSLLPTSIEAVGGRIFPDETSLQGQLDFSQVIRLWQSVHSPSFGSAIGQTGATNSVSGAETLLSVSKSQVAEVQTMEFTNAGGAAPITITLKLGGVACSLDSGLPIVVGPGASIAISTMKLRVDANLPLTVVIDSGTGSDLTSKVAYILTSQ